MSDNLAPRVEGNGGAQVASARGRLLHPVDCVIALFLLAGCAWLYYETTQFDEVSFLFADNLPPAFFPRIWIISIAVLSVLLPFEHILLKKQGKNIDKDRSSKVENHTWLTKVLLVGIGALAPVIGIYFTLIAVCLLLPLLWGEKRFWVLLPFAVGFPTLVALLFNVVLGVPFDPGLIGISLR